MYSAIVPDLKNELIAIDFVEILNEEIAEGKASPDTIAMYTVGLKQFLIWCKYNRINPIYATRNTIKSYRLYLNRKKKYKSSTVAGRLSVVRRFFSILVEREIVSINPAVGIKAPVEREQPEANTNFLSKEEAQRLINVLPEDNTLVGLRDRLLVALMMIEGCRQIELYRLNVGDLERAAGKKGIKVRGKRSIRIIPLNDDVAKLLDRYLKARRKVEKLLLTSPMFISVSKRNYGGRLTRRSMSRIADKYLEAAKLKHQESKVVSAHGLRRTAGYLSQLSGASLRETQHFLGHSDPKITALYTPLPHFWANPPAARFGLQI